MTSCLQLAVNHRFEWTVRGSQLAIALENEWCRLLVQTSCRQRWQLSHNLCQLSSLSQPRSPGRCDGRFPTQACISQDWSGRSAGKTSAETIMKKGFRRWVEAIWSLRTRPEDTFNDCPAEQTKSWYDISGMANDDVRAHMEFVTKLFEESIKVKTAYIDYRRVLPSDRVSFQQFMKADIKEHILRNERRMEQEATEEEEEGHPHHPANKCFVGGRVKANASQFSVFCWSSSCYSTQALLAPERSVNNNNVLPTCWLIH